MVASVYTLQKVLEQVVNPDWQDMKMNRDELRNLLKQPVKFSERNLGCPDDYALASYVEGGLSERDHNNFELHLSDCDFCLERVGLLGRANDTEQVDGVSELLMASSRNLPRDGTHKRNGLRYAPRWATAALVVLTFGLLLNLEPSNQDSPELTSPAIPQQRSVDPYALLPQVISPADGSTINPTTQQFTWTPIRDSLYYQVRIVSDVGDLVWQERVNGTQWQLPVGISLPGNAEYFVRVDAYLTEAKSFNSDYVVFKVEADN